MPESSDGAVDGLFCRRGGCWPPPADKVLVRLEIAVDEGLAPGIGEPALVLVLQAGRGSGVIVARLVFEAPPSSEGAGVLRTPGCCRRLAGRLPDTEDEGSDAATRREPNLAWAEDSRLA